MSSSVFDMDSFWEKLPRFCRPVKMSPRDQLLLDPWEKWKKYHRLPLKIILHTLLVGFVLILILLIVSQYSTYANESTDTFRALFTPSQFKDHVYTISDCVDAVRGSLNRYYNFGNQSVDRYLHVDPDNSIVTLTVKRYVYPFWNTSSNSFNYQYFSDTSTSTESYNITLNDLGPLNGTLEEVGNYFYSIVSMQTEFYLTNLNIGPFGLVPFRWQITLKYDLENSGGKVDFTIITNKYLITGNPRPLSLFLWLNIVVGLLALWSFILSIKGVIQSWAVFKNVRRKFEKQIGGGISFGAKFNDLVVEDKLENHYKKWSDIPWKVKLKFFDGWNITTIFGSMGLIISSILGVYFESGNVNEFNYHITLAIGAFLVVMNMMRYLEYNHSFYTLILTLKNALGDVLNYLISVLPMYVAFALFGVLIFSQYAPQFVDFPTTCITLFALMNGDSILNTFDALNGRFPNTTIPSLYISFYLIFFITSVLNVFIFIIESAFRSAQRTAREAEEKLIKKGLKVADDKFDITSLFEIIESRRKRSPAFSIQDSADSEADILLASQDAIDLSEQSPQDIRRDESRNTLEDRLSEMVRLEQEKFLQQMQEIQIQFTERVQEQMLAVVKEFNSQKN